VVHLLFALAGFAAAPAPADDDRPHLRLWTNHEDPYRKGESARVYLQVDRDAFVTVVRVDTDGRMRILFPAEPWGENRARGGRSFEVVGPEGEPTFEVDDDPGLGYVFAVASVEPFNYDAFTARNRWDYRVVEDGWVRGDPYVALTDFAAQIAGGSRYDYDVTSYSVDRVYTYPRFVCYDCHSHLSYSAWDPYAAFCTRFRLLVYDDPYYYPYLHYGRNVVMVRPLRPGPRFVFKDPGTYGAVVTTIPNRPRAGLDGGEGGPDRSSQDFGGHGAVPAPVEPRIRPPVSTPAPSGALAPRAAPPPEPPRSLGPTTSQPRIQPQAPKGKQPAPTKGEKPKSHPTEKPKTERRPEKR